MSCRYNVQGQYECVEGFADFKDDKNVNCEHRCLEMTCLKKGLYYNNNTKKAWEKDSEGIDREYRHYSCVNMQSKHDTVGPQGNDLMTIPNTDIENCKQKCAMHPDCKALMFKADRCFLKTKHFDPINAEGWTTAQKKDT